MRFASHRDIARAVERGVRRAGLPIAYSAGFTPHPKISYAGAAPTGTASEAEYLELSLTDARAVAEVRDGLDAALPDGIDVIDVTEETGSLGAAVAEASQWQVVLPGVGPQQAAAAVAAFLATDTLEVERLTSKGIRRMDARAAVVTIETDRRAADERNAGYAILRMVVRHVTPAVRPDDILAALRRVAALAPSSPPLVTRLAQGSLAAMAAAAGPDKPGRPSGTAAPPGTRSPGNASVGTGSMGTGSSGTTGSSRTTGSLLVAAEAHAQGAAQGQIETTRPGALAVHETGTIPASAYDQLLRGAAGSLRTHAPGSLTGDNPDARDRAERQREQR
jgi:radical SAM-linked protein